MANTRSAEKQERQAVKRNAQNRAVKTRLRTSLKKARTAAAGGNADLSAGFSEIDKAAKKGVIKKNTASRYKSRLAKSAKRASAK
ncbi:MAG TPA: 30S ribosomal protein S20 [Thermoanaerobaculia bacterium]|jgi:small subunit ribosomal protein S20